MDMKQIMLAAGMLVSLSGTVQAADRLELQTTFIKGNTEMPQIIYIVPWQDMKQEKNKEQTLVLHSLFGDLFEPVNYKSVPAPNPTK
ncbi:MAG: hypothetical protein CVV05_02375 [Gammaproteobacteria bacterium HGW-Gammaproteobacteria-1]|jgi:hypothetical protein|nr:MAG: hypothetical protein CVV05_02375 [Gammaproteobacteria bacterium HGW-Gammaproteobacteria-1]